MIENAEQRIVIFYVREGRDKAMPLAREEALNALAPFSPELMEGGPLTGQKKVFCMKFDSSLLEQDVPINAFMRLGYTEKVSMMVEADLRDKRKLKSGAGIVWKNRYFREQILFQEDKALMRLKDPDQRVFLLQKETGIESVKGYRGHGEHFGRRALPVSDCRLLINLSLSEKAFDGSEYILLDPFAGAGGIVTQAKEFGLTTYSADIDASLQPGLAAISTKHLTANANELRDIVPESIDAIATEIPFEEKFTPDVVSSFKEMARVLKPKGKIAMMTALHQAGAIQESARDNGFNTTLRQTIDRKGTDVEIFVFEKQDLEPR